jgi:hypothetical protein
MGSDFDRPGTLTWVGASKHARASAVSTFEFQWRRNAGISGAPSLRYRKPVQAKVAVHPETCLCAAEPARRGPRQEATVVAGGTASTPSADNQIFEQLNTESRDEHVLSSLPHIFYTG